MFAFFGGYFVAKSFAGSGEGSYNAKAFDCTEGVNTGLGLVNYQKWQDCVNNSAESLVYNYYRLVFNREPDRAGMRYWAGRLTKSNPDTPYVIARLMLGSNEGKKLNAKANKDFVTTLFKQGLQETPSAGRVKYWTEHISKRNMSKPGIVEYFAKTDVINQKLFHQKVEYLLVEGEFLDFPPSRYLCENLERTFNSDDYNSGSKLQDDECLALKGTTK